METGRHAHERITDALLAQMEAGVTPWRKRWKAGHSAGPITRPLRHTFEPYRGVNVLQLWAAAFLRDYESPLWMTYRQAAELGGQVRKGEKSALVVFAKPVEKEGGDGENDRYFVWRGYSVFNTSQIDGLPPRFADRDAGRPVLDPALRVAALEQFVAATGAIVHHGGGRAFYRPSTGDVTMPDFDRFESPDAYYATLLHELVHWTAPRLERDLDRGMEELVAELGAAFLCADLGVADLRDEHAGYLDGWMKTMRADSRAILRAASHAERAAAHLLELGRPRAAEAA